MAYGSSTVKRRRRSRAELAEVDDAIVTAVAAEHPVTLRGVHYRVVSAGAVDKTEDGYRLVGRQLLRLRRDGVIPYHYITDGTRWVVQPTSYRDAQAALDDVAASYRRQLWRDQRDAVHLFTEKDAISGVIHPVTDRWQIPMGVLRGYASESIAHSMAEAIRDGGKRHVFVYQLGDHDPSGVDAWRSFRERVTCFLGEPVTPELAAAARKIGGVDLTVGVAFGVDDGADAPDHWNPDDDVWMHSTTYHFLGGHGFRDADLRTLTFARLAVLPEQIEQMRLPTRPTKRTDSRSAGFTGESVEVDAIPPTMLREIVDNAITGHIDPEALRLHRLAEEQERAGLRALAGGGW